MNWTLVDELASILERESPSVLIQGDSIPEIQEAFKRQGIEIRIIGPREFSMPAILEAERKSLLAYGGDTTAAGFWTGFRQKLRIPSSVQGIVFRDIDQLDDTHASALESLAKGDMDDAIQGTRFIHIWATSTSLAPFNSRLERAFAYYFVNMPRWLRDLESKAACSLRNKMESWPGDVYACPWLRWYFSVHHKKGPTVVFVLQDWGIASDETLTEAVELLESQAGDRTIKAITQNRLLSPLIENGSVCVLNAVWGLRKSEKTGYLGDEIHGLAFPIWVEALKKLRPNVVCLCGEWAKWKDLDWGIEEDGSSQIRRWLKFQPTSSINPDDLAGVNFRTIPHPSAWTFDFPKFVEGLCI